jgi:flavin-binding protein dodecin
MAKNKKKADKTASKIESGKKSKVEVVEAVEVDEDEEVEAPSKKKSSSKAADFDGSVYKIIEVVGSSTKSWEHAAQVAINRASQTLDDLRIAEVVDQDLKIEDGQVAAYRTRLRLSFKYRD